MTTRELLPALGEKVSVRFEDLAIECIVLDAKTSWGKPRLQVRPVTGQGRQWIELSRLVAPVKELAR